jgi:RimJ/RimL family protein N-acetyltransferase
MVPGMSDPTNDSRILSILGERVALGPLHRDLIPLYTRWVNDLPARVNLGSHAPVTREQEEEWYDSTIKAGNQTNFTVYEREGPQPIGTAGLFDIDHRNRRAEFGILLGEAEYRNRGYGTEATRLVLDYAFTAAGLHNVILSVFEFNRAAVRAYEKAGFREIGRRREAHFAAGEWWDEILMDCLSPVLRRRLAPDGRD